MDRGRRPAETRERRGGAAEGGQSRRAAGGPGEGRKGGSGREAAEPARARGVGRVPEVWHGMAKGRAERAGGVVRMARSKRARRVGCKTQGQVSTCSLEEVCGLRGGPEAGGRVHICLTVFVFLYCTPRWRRR